MSAARRDRGVALLITIMALLLLSALGAALTLTSASETIISAHFRDALESRYAADAVLGRALDETAAMPDWTTVIDGTRQSSWVDGPPSGPRTLSDGTTIDLGQTANLAGCQKSTPCSAADLVAVTADRPWGANNPRWTAFAYGPLQSLLPSGAIDAPQYVIVLAANGPAPGLLALRAEAFGPRGAHAVIEVTAGRDYNEDSTQSPVNVLSWREVR
jgi:hypothetical protein